MQLIHMNATTLFIDRHLEEGRADRPALRTRTETWSYGELSEQAGRAGAALLTAGAGRGERVLIVLPDTLQAAAIAFGAMHVGAVPALVHTRLSDDELAFVAGDARPRVAVATPDRVPALLAIRRRLGWPETIIAAGSGELPVTSEPVIRAAEALASAEPADAVPCGPDDAALLQYTSGSTGRPKAVVHLHRGLLALPDGFGRRLDLTEHDVCYSAAKLSFGYGFGASLLFPLAAGASALLRAEPSEPLGVLETIAAQRPSVFFGGPALYTAMLAVHNPHDPLDTSSLRLCVSAGEALDERLFRRWQTTFGLPILDGLGSTECLHIFVSGEPGALRPGSLGTAVPPYEVRLLDDHGVEVGPGRPGHVHVRGPANGARYWERLDATQTTMRDGWTRTGDLMRRAEDGTFTYVGRSDDVFKVRGMKVAPLEIEACLNAHPAVAESAVTPVADRNNLTIACAYVRLEGDVEPTRELVHRLKSHARQQLSPHRVPRLVRFVDALPRTETGKLSRRGVAALAASTTTEGRTMLVTPNGDAPAPLEARGLSRHFRQGAAVIHAVDDVDLTIARGELVAIMGPSGSGKSTLLHLLGGIDHPDAGEVLVEGRAISALAPQELALVRRRRLGFLLQFFSLLPTLTALENVAFPLLLDGVPDASRRAEEALAHVEMSGRASHRPSQLSGGEQQRVALARALVIEPAIVLADEPTGNLDSVSGREILALLRDAADSGQSVVMVTHDPVAAEHADRIVQMADGRTSEVDDEPALPARRA